MDVDGPARIFSLAGHERDEVRLCLDDAGLPEIGQHRRARPFVGLSAHLSESQYGHIEILGEVLQASCDLRDLLLSARRPWQVRRSYFLQIVHDDES